MIKAVVIDFDDTLCLTEAACFKLENEVLAQLGRPPMTHQVHKATWGQPLLEAITTRSPGVDVEAFHAAYEPTIKQHIAAGDFDSIPKANLAALNQLSTEGKQLMVLTSRNHTELEHILEPAHELASHIDTFYYRDNMQFHKPDPRAFAGLLADHNLQPEECVYIGDSPSDAAAANQAGLKFICSLESGLRTPADFANYQVDAFIQTFPEVVAATNRLQ